MGIESDAELSRTVRLPRDIGGRAPRRGRAEDRRDRSESGCDKVEATEDAISGKAEDAEDLGTTSILATACCCAMANDSKACAIK
jgi:hypothetical protein